MVSYSNISYIVITDAYNDGDMRCGGISVFHYMLDEKILTLLSTSTWTLGSDDYVLHAKSALDAFLHVARAD